MAVSPAALLLALLAVSVLVAGSQAWLLAFAKLVISRRWLSRPAVEYLSEGLRKVGIAPALPLIPYSPRRPVPWALFDVIAVVAMWLIGSEMVKTALEEAGWLSKVKNAANLPPNEQATLIAALSIVSLLTVMLGWPLTAARTGARSIDFGWSMRHVFTDLRLGLVGFVMLAPPVYVLQALLVLFWKKSQHPLIEMFQASPDPAFFILLFVSAAVVAPLIEEWIFRVMLQGFLEKAIAFHGSTHELFLGSGPWQTGIDSLHGAEAKVQIDAGPKESAAPQLDEEKWKVIERRDPFFKQPELRGLAALLPIAISSIIFALMHYSHGPDWIPLTFLAAGMGYLYQRTHRLLPSLIVHVLINSSSLLALWVQVYEAKG